MYDLFPINLRYSVFVTICVVIGPNLCGAISKNFNLRLQGQISAWSSETVTSDMWENNSGLRYIPTFSAERSLADGHFLESDIAFNSYWSVSNEHKSLAEVELYRLKIQLASVSSDLRLGLQKISFGPGQLLRPLMWFDYIDPRDPLKMTDGVWGIRYRRFFSNNANLWLWSLYGNEEIRGIDEHATAKDKPEFGGRFQYPIPRGEAGISLHHRQALTSDTMSSFTGNRLAFDGRWDVLIGLWFETVIIDRRTENISYEWLKLSMIGGDFTFDLGNGLYVLCEHERISHSKKWHGYNRNINLSSYMLSYPLNLFDNVNLFGIYLWKQEKLYNYLGWRRIYDNWMINLNLFLYPERTSINDNNPGVINSGQGVQLMLIYNH